MRAGGSPERFLFCLREGSTAATALGYGDGVGVFYCLPGGVFWG